MVTNLENFSDEDVCRLAESVVDRSRDAALNDDQQAVVDYIEISMVDVSSLIEPEDIFFGSTFDESPADLYIDLLPEVAGQVKVDGLAELISKRKPGLKRRPSVPPSEWVVEEEVPAADEPESEPVRDKIVLLQGEAIGFGLAAKIFVSDEIATQFQLNSPRRCKFQPHNS